jgi:hypothetical protein
MVGIFVDVLKGVCNGKERLGFVFLFLNGYLGWQSELIVIKYCIYALHQTHASNETGKSLNQCTTASPNSRHFLRSDHLPRSDPDPMKHAI